jgi:2-polyprenyl-6-methoxyphenol hydroxylase-like FAD-dependent oxidoreductase
MKRRAIIIGGSIGGLFAGLLLRRIGWDVSIFERNGIELGSRGAGIVTHSVLLDLLAFATGSRADIGITVSGRAVLAVDGSTVCENHHPQTLASWDQVWLRLHTAAQSFYHFDHKLESVESKRNGVEAIFANGTRHQADILIAADGIQSMVRRMLMPEVAPAYAGYIAWRGLVDAADLSDAAKDALLGRFAFCLPPSEQMLGYPVDAGSKGELRYNYVWYRPADTEYALPRLLRDKNGIAHTGGIPPDQIHPDVLAEMRNAAAALLAPAFSEVVHKTRQPLLQPIVDLQVPSMRKGRVVLLGDAAFVARPHVGMGVTKAAVDAAALVRNLEGNSTTAADLDTSLEAYSFERVTEGQRIIRRARHLGAYMQAQLLSDDERLQANLHRSPQAIMVETATMQGIENW